MISQLKIQKIKPVSNCKSCYGTGQVVDYVPYGNTDVPMYSTCECVGEQLDQYEGLVEEAKSLVDKLEQICFEHAPTVEEDQRLDRIYSAAISRLWRRQDILKQAENSF